MTVIASDTPLPPPLIPFKPAAAEAEPPSSAIWSEI